jgi:uncharacterized protein with ATP-grasp and redox domains
LRQALTAARFSGADEPQQYAILQQTLQLLQDVPARANPPEIGSRVHHIVQSQLGVADPYAAVKQASTRQALELYPRLKAMVRESADPLGLAIRLSIAGNILDFAVSDQIADLWSTVERVVHQAYAIDDSPALKARLSRVEYLLYLADNAGETVFDRVLIETLGVPVIYAVKGGPVLNDVTLPGALEAGLDGCARLIDNGARAAGTVLSLCSAEFRRQFVEAPLVIAKGQANYETLSEAGEKVFCLLQAKCPVIAADLGVPLGSIVARQNRAPQAAAIA